ncbi:amino acid ABC transporter permease [Paenibacillus hamazuiensis]|uniref:amino acid ABC transporter permease n=1 Tax=Paenibacillus hamazuiensis TaxID=2936508 RepID=UPI0020107DE2|nr:amino acid ABC transporter permease [Paenibacillus hamazuiensis]
MGKAFDPLLIWEYLPKLLQYLPTTLLILAASVLLGVAIGLLLALIRLYRLPVLNQLVIAYVSFTRGTPILIQLFLVYYGIPELLRLISIEVSDIHALVFVIVTYGLHFAAFFSEVVRAAVLSVDRGQMEAAHAVGMTGRDAFFRIVFPQALMVAFPNFANLVVSSLKDTSLAFSLGVMDMVGRAETLGTSGHFLEIFIALGIIYYAICVLLERGFAIAERRLQRHEREAQTASSRSGPEPEPGRIGGESHSY